MARKKKKRVYVNAGGEALSHLSEKPSPSPEPKGENAKASKGRSKEQAEGERLRQARERELEAINHEIEVEKRRTMAATWKTKTQNAELGILDDNTANTQTRSLHLEEVELKMRELEAAEKFGVEKVARVRAKAIQIFHKLHMRKSEKCAQILEVLNAYEVDESVLPLAIQELIEEETYVNEQ